MAVKGLAKLHDSSLGIGAVQLFRVTRLTTRLPTLEGAKCKLRALFGNLGPACRLITCVRSWLQERTRRLALETGDVSIEALVSKG